VLWPVLTSKTCTWRRSNKTCLSADRNSCLSLSLWKYNGGYSHYCKDYVPLVVSRWTVSHASDINLPSWLFSQGCSVIHVHFQISWCQTPRECVHNSGGADSLSSAELLHAAWEAGVVTKLMGTEIGEILLHQRAAEVFLKTVEKMARPFTLLYLRSVFKAFFRAIWDSSKKQRNHFIFMANSTKF